MACCTVDAFNIVGRLDHDGNFDEAPQNKKRKLATGLSRDKLYEQDFHCYAFLPPAQRLFYGTFRTASVPSHTGVALCSSSLDFCLRKDYVPGKDASVKCFDASLGKVRLLCLRSIALRKVPGRWILASTLLSSCLWHPCCQALCTEAFTSFCHACDGTMRSKLPRHHCLLHPHVAESCTVFLFLFFPFVPTVAFANFFSMFPSSWPDTAFFRSCPRLPPGFP